MAGQTVGIDGMNKAHYEAELDANLDNLITKVKICGIRIQKQTQKGKRMGA